MKKDTNIDNLIMEALTLSMDKLDKVDPSKLTKLAQKTDVVIGENTPFEDYAEQLENGYSLRGVDSTTIEKITSTLEHNNIPFHFTNDGAFEVIHFDMSLVNAPLQRFFYKLLKIQEGKILHKKQLKENNVAVDVLTNAKTVVFQLISELGLARAAHYLQEQLPITALSIATLGTQEVWGDSLTKLLTPINPAILQRFVKDHQSLLSSILNEQSTSQQEQSVFDLKAWFSELEVPLSAGTSSNSNLISFNFQGKNGIVIISVDEVGDIRIGGNKIKTLEDCKNMISFFRD